MSDVKQHYDRHLGPMYSWMSGGFDFKSRENMEFFTSNKISPKGNRLAIDLGSGNGFQSIPLAQLGFKVKAIDISGVLIAELKNHAAGLPVEAIESDLLEYLSVANDSPELIVCMGDTLTHLADASYVDRMVGLAYDRLSSGGKFIVSFRDLTGELEGDQRFIPVRSDDKHIFTCFIEYFPGRVRVHDILHSRENDGWKQTVSSYFKLRLSGKNILRDLEKRGFKIVSEDSDRGFVRIICQK